jgi:predicted PurR-regulated permease PerM
MASGYDDRYDPERDAGGDDGHGRVSLADVRNRVKTPATVMLVFAILSTILAPIGAINFFTLPKQMEQQRKQIDQDPNMPANQKKQVKDLLNLYEDIILKVLPFSIGLNLIVGVISIIGSLKMLNLKSWGWGMTTAILSIISIGHGCCCLTFPIGIWALIVLMNSDVKAGFAAAARQRETEADRGYDDRDRDRDRY